jgi:hypothetical protein
MISIQLMGGLGNQLFQMAWLFSYAKKYNKSFMLPSFMESHDRNTYWPFFTSLNSHLVSPVSLRNLRIVEEPHFHYAPELDQDHGDNFIFKGYFQSWKYFHQHRDSILLMLNIHEMQENEIDNLNLDHTVSMHFRRGDYRNLTHIYSILEIDYYDRALNHFSNMEIPFVVYFFYQESDLEEVRDIINRLQEIFPLYTFLSGTHGREDWQQLLLMSLCTHHIIANSTFSWWGAYLGNQENITIYPSTWFAKGVHHNICDLFPSHWISL